MNELISHIEFLLHEHNCVIIPGFGGFVVNTLPSRRDGIATFLEPSCELVFNRDLTHNDGLLAQSYMRSDKLMFEAAMQRIERAVEELKNQLREVRRVDLGKLGSFTMNDEKRFMYTPANFVRPSLFGLTRATLKPLVQMQTPSVPPREMGRERRWSQRGVSAAAAVAIILLMFLLPVSDTNREHQSAQMISETSLFGNKHNHAHGLENVTPNAGVDGDANILPVSPSVTANTTDATLPAPTGQELAAGGPRYYVVVGVYELPDVAQKMMETLRNEGFAHMGSLKRSGRIDVYAASFTERSEAESFMKEIHKQYPTHSDAWILKRK